MSGKIVLPDGRVCEMINDEKTDEELLAELEEQQLEEEYAEEFKNNFDDTEEAGIFFTETMLANMNAHINKIQTALEIAHNIITALLLENGNKPVTFTKELMDSVVSEPRFTFGVVSNDDGTVTVSPKEMTPEQIEAILQQNG